MKRFVLGIAIFLYSFVKAQFQEIKESSAEKDEPAFN